MRARPRRKSGASPRCVSRRRAAKLIQDVLNYSRIVRADFPLETVDVDQLLRGIAETYPMLLPEKADVVLEASSRGCWATKRCSPRSSPISSATR